MLRVSSGLSCDVVGGYRKNRRSVVATRRRHARPARNDAAVSDLADRIERNAVHSIRAVKQALIELAKPEAEWDLDAPEAVVAMCRTSEDHEEGRRAFIEKRGSQFQGR